MTCKRDRWLYNTWRSLVGGKSVSVKAVSVERKGMSMTNECGWFSSVIDKRMWKKGVSDKRVWKKGVNEERCGRRVSLTNVWNKGVTDKRVWKVSCSDKRVWKKGVIDKRVWKKGVSPKRVWKKGVTDKRMWKKGVIDKRVWKKGVSDSWQSSEEEQCQRQTNMEEECQWQANVEEKCSWHKHVWKKSISDKRVRKKSVNDKRAWKKNASDIWVCKKRLCLISREEDGYDKWLWKTIASHYYVSMQEVCQWWAKYERIIIMVSHKPLIEVSGGRLSVTVWKVHAWSCSDKWRWKKIVSDTLKDDACMHFEGRCMHAHAVTSEGGRRTSVTIWKHGQCDKWSWKRIVKEGQGLSVTIKWAWIEISSYMYDRRLPVGMQVSMDKVFFKQLSRLSVMTPPHPHPPITWAYLYSYNVKRNWCMFAPSPSPTYLISVRTM